MLPPFNFHQPVSPEAGQLDRMELTIGSWIVSTGPDDVCALKSALAGPPAGVPNGVASGAFGWIFNSPRDHAIATSDQKVRQTHREGAPDGSPPLFSGILLVKPEPGFYRLFVNLDLNPARYSQSLCERHLRDAPTDSISRLRKFPMPLAFDGEVALDQRDNWIPNVPGYRAVYEIETARGLVLDYLRNVDAALDAEFQRAAQLHTIALRREPRFDLRQAEVYWEFACPEPLALYRVLEPAFKSFRGLVRRRHYVNADLTATAAEIIQNCPCWSFSAADGGTLKVYAKTNRRLRVEVAFRVAEVPDVKVRSESRIGLLTQVEELRQRAAEQVNELFAHLADCFPTEPPLPHPGDPLRLLLDFVSVVRGACESGTNTGSSPETLSYLLLSLLREHGAIRTPPSSPLRRAVRELARKSPPFLKCSGRGRGARYMLAPKYRPIFAILFQGLTAEATVPASLRPVPTPPPEQIPDARPRELTPDAIPPARTRLP